MARHRYLDRRGWDGSAGLILVRNGFSLVEVLIALVVIGAGLLVLATFQGRLTTESVDAKIRSEALHIAQARIEQLRNQDLGSIAEVEDEPVEGSGPVDQFLVTVTVAEPVFSAGGATVTPEDEVMLEVRIVVGWRDHRDEQQQVEASTYVAASAFAGSVDPGAGTGGGNLPLVPAPFGGAELVRGKYFDEGTGEVLLPTNPQEAVNLDDGTAFFRNIEDRVEIIDVETGDALVLANSANLPAKITGYVYFDSSANGSSGNTVVVATPVALCVKGQGLDVEGVNGITRFRYSCYIAGRNVDSSLEVDTFGWYGNIGVLQPTTGVNQVDDVCVGAVPANEAPDLTAEAAKIRWYRGYTEDPPAALGVIGTPPIIGSDGQTILFPIGIVGNELPVSELELPGFTGHNFLVTTLQGSETCATRMQAIHSAGVSSDEAFGNSAGGRFAVEAGATTETFDTAFVGPNPTRQFCFGLKCPEPEPPLEGPGGCDTIGAVCTTGDYDGFVYAGVLNGKWLFTTAVDEPNTYTHANAVLQCSTKGTGGWWLPGSNVLRDTLFESRAAIGGFQNQRYWSADTAVVKQGNSMVTEGLYVAFNNGSTGTATLTQAYRVRCLFQDGSP